MIMKSYEQKCKWFGELRFWNFEMFCETVYNNGKQNKMWKTINRFGSNDRKKYLF